MQIKEVTDARKKRINHEAAWQILGQAETITIAKGKKQLTFTPADDNREEILKAAMGPSGNLRAPTLRLGKRLVIGFNPELYQTIFS